MQIGGEDARRPQDLARWHLYRQRQKGDSEMTYRFFTYKPEGCKWYSLPFTALGFAVIKWAV